MDIMLKFGTKGAPITKGLLKGCNGDMEEILVNTARLCNVDLARGRVTGDLLGFGEFTYGIGLDSPDIEIHSLDLFIVPVAVVNMQGDSPDAERSN